MRILLNMLAIIISGYSARLMAVEPANLEERFALVGVISESTNGQKGVAVLKDQLGGKTYTLRIGDRIPVEGNFVLHSVSKRNVHIDNGRRRINITYAGKTEYEEKNEEQELSKVYFLDDESDEDESDDPQSLQALFNRYYVPDNSLPPTVWMPGRSDVTTEQKSEVRGESTQTDSPAVEDEEDDSLDHGREERDAASKPNMRILQNTSLLDRAKIDGDVIVRRGIDLTPAKNEVPLLTE